MDTKMVKELLLQSLEHEMGGVKVYETALKCVVNDDLKEEWEKYLEETEKHVQVLHDACLQLNLDPEEQTPGRKITHDIGASLIAAMETALGTGALRVALAQGEIAIASGQLRLANTAVRAKDAELGVSLGIDLSGSAIDARLVLSGAPGTGALEGVRPEIALSLRGPFGEPKRTRALRCSLSDASSSTFVGRPTEASAHELRRSACRITRSRSERPLA